jgi:hypothetical protein
MNSLWYIGAGTVLVTVAALLYIASSIPSPV